MDTSARSSAQTGTMGHSRASASNPARSGRIRSSASTTSSSWMRETPDRRSGAGGGSRCERSIYARVGTGLREPRRHTQVVPCVRIRRRLSLLGGVIVNGARGAAGILRPHAPVTRVRAHAPRGSGRRRHRESPVAAARGVHPPGDGRRLHHAPAGPADDAEDRRRSFAKRWTRRARRRSGCRSCFLRRPGRRPVGTTSTATRCSSSKTATGGR